MGGSDAGVIGWTSGSMVIAARVCDRTESSAYKGSGVMFRGQYDEAGVEIVGQAIRQLGQKLSTMLF